MIGPMSGGTSAAAPEPERESGGVQRDTAGAATSPDAPPRSEATPPGTPPRSAGRATHGEFLITSDERDAAEARLRRAVADEVLSLEEFGDRMRLLLAAKTRGDLHQAVAGLPDVRERPARTAERGHMRPARPQGAVVAILSSSETRGQWRPGHTTTAIAALGEATVDLQGAEYEDDELVINAFSMLGTVEIVVPEGVEVELRGHSILGDRSDRTDGMIVAGAPVVRVEGLALLGEITVRHPKARERFVSPDGRGPFADRLPQATARQRAEGAARRRRRSHLATARRWGAGVLAAIALALPLAWTLGADDVAGAVFGSTQQTVSAAALEADRQLSVGTPVAFGSVEVVVPEGVNVERDGVVIFGSTSCEPSCGVAAADAPTVQIRSFGAFGSVEIVQAPAAGTN